MKKHGMILSVLFLMCTVGYAVTLEKNEKEWTVKNQFYTVKFEKKNDYIPRFIQINGKNLDWTVASPSLMLNRETEVFRKLYNSSDSAVSLRSMQIKPESVEVSPEKIVLRLTGNFSGGSLTQEMIFDNSELIRYQAYLRSSGVYLSRFEVRTGINLNDDGGIFYPDEKRIPGVWHENGTLTEGHCWKYAWFEKSGVGFGLMTDPVHEIGGVEYSMQNRKEGWNSNYAGIRAISVPLRKFGKNAEIQFRCHLLAGGTPGRAQKIADQILGTRETPYLFSLETEKLHVRPGNENRVFAELRNPGKTAANVRFALRMTYGLNTWKEISSQEITLQAGEKKIAEIPVVFPKDVRHGVTFTGELTSSEGKLLDRKSEVSAVTDFAPRDTAFAIINPEMTHQVGSYHAWNNGFKQNYVGVYGYYSWQPASVFGLVPETETWSPDNSTNYSKQISKQFLKNLISNAHSKGIHVYSWFSPSWNYKVAMQHPDWLLYTADGQPNIYVTAHRRNGARRVMIRPNIYPVDHAAEWGKEFADSIDEFGWDGAYHGFVFVPVPSDQGAEAKDWFDHKGRSRAELFPDPGKSGVAGLSAWKREILKRHPQFVPGHSSLDDEFRKDYPEYFSLACRNSLILMGDMISGYLDRYPTYEEWTRELSRRDNKIRQARGTSAMGTITVKPSHSEAYHLANYAAASSGLKCWGSNSLQIGERSGERNRYLMRFAEYYFGHDFLLPETIPAVQISGKEVLFEPFVRQRSIKGWKEIVIPIVNVCGKDPVSVFRPETIPAKNLSFRLEGITPSEAWLMTPWNLENAVKLSIADGVVVIPELRDAALLLIRCKE